MRPGGWRSQRGRVHTAIPAPFHQARDAVAAEALDRPIGTVRTDGRAVQPAPFRLTSAGRSQWVRNRRARRQWRQRGTPTGSLPYARGNRTRCRLASVPRCRAAAGATYLPRCKRSGQRRPPVNPRPRLLGERHLGDRPHRCLGGGRASRRFRGAVQVRYRTSPSAWSSFIHAGQRLVARATT
jgi:hypothetical protein